MKRLVVFALAALAAGGCASPAPPPATGWIELALADAEIPADPLGDPIRPRCRLILSLDGEPILDQELEPRGDVAPYQLERSFRVQVAAGRYRARVHYIGCRFAGKRADAIEAELEVPVVAGRTTRVHFDGPTLRWEGFFPAEAL